METLACNNVTPNHSEDRVTVSAGHEQTLVLCGYHATYFLTETLKANNH